LCTGVSKKSGRNFLGKFVMWVVDFKVINYE
jgi:hypothetical protein